MSSKIHPKIALVYDRVNTPFGGAENVLLAIHELFPHAPLYTSVYNPQTATWASVFDVRPSFLQHIPFAKQFHRHFVPFMPLAFESLDLSDFDIIISITSAEAKGVLTKPHQLHICYLLTPTRYLWSHRDEYQTHWLTGWIRRAIFQYLQWWDEAAALRPDVFIPISELVAKRCQQYYHRATSGVIYPTVGTNTKIKTDIPLGINDFYLIVSRLVPYKRIDLAIQAVQKMGRNLVIIGQGPDLSRLQRLAKVGDATSKITFLQAVQSTQVIAYYNNCRAFLAPAEEDFGITVLEAQAAGKPVIVYARSGGAEVMLEGKTGITFKNQTVSDLVQAMQKVEHQTWDTQFIQEYAYRYNKHTFQANFQKQVSELIKDRERAV